jgi:hypothetical protein
MKIEIQKVSRQDEETVQKIFEAAPTYFRRVDGVEVEKHFARREINDEAKKKSSTYEKVESTVIEMEKLLEFRLK